MSKKEEDYFYLLGLLLSKGKAQVNNYRNCIDFIFEIRFNKPTASSLRSDNIHNIRRGAGEEMYDYLLGDIIRIQNLLQTIFYDCKVLLEHIPEPSSRKDFSKKIVRWIVRKIPKKHSFVRFFWKGERFDSPRVLDKIPKSLVLLKEKIVKNKLLKKEKSYLKSFLQGISDAAAVIPGPESSAFGAEGTPRIQIEVDNSRWMLNIYMCLFFEEVFKVPVHNINWPHPTIKGRRGPEKVLKHNHQFRVHLWFFKKVGFKLSIKKRNFELFIEELKKKYKGKYPKQRPHLSKRKNFKYIGKDEYLKKYPKIQGYTTNPFLCTKHCENSETLPPEIRNKHYAEWRDINYDLGDPMLDEYPSNISKNKNS